MDTIYCVEDDENIRDLITYTLQSSGFAAQGFTCASELMNALRSKKPDLLLLDIMLPGVDGLSILKDIRENDALKNMPVILLTAKTSEYDKIVGLDSGADDYVAKPFSVMELLSRIKALLRRAKAHQSPDGAEELCIGGGLLTLHPAFHRVKVNNREVALTFKEFELLHYLMNNKNIVVSRDKIINKVWDYDYMGETRTVDVHIRTLRQKLKEAGALIETIRGVGYKIGDGPCRK